MEEFPLGTKSLNVMSDKLQDLQYSATTNFQMSGTWNSMPR